MSLGTPSHRDSDGLFRLVADSLPLLVWISGLRQALHLLQQAVARLHRATPRVARSAMAGQTACTPPICRIAWTRTLAPSTVVNRS